MSVNDHSLTCLELYVRESATRSARCSGQ